MYEEAYLAHHGIKGQKWGIRRFQNEDGTLTIAGKKRYGSENSSESNISKKNSSTAKLLAAGAITAMAVTGASIYYSKNKDSVNAVVKKLSESTMKSIKNKAKSGKNYLVDIKDNVKRGVKEGINSIPKAIGDGIANAPGKVAKGLAEGAGIIVAKKVLDKAIGKKNADKYIKAYNAYNKKNKIGRVDRDEEES